MIKIGMNKIHTCRLQKHYNITLKVHRNIFDRYIIKPIDPL